MQTLRVAERYKDPSLKTGALISTTGRKRQGAGVQKSTQLIVGTPGRLLEAYRARKLKRVTTVVLDEPDSVLSGREAEYLRSVLTRPEPKVQLIVAAATLGPRAETLITEIMGDDHYRTAVEDNPLRDAIAHHFVRLREGASPDVRLASIIQEQRCERAIVFANEPAAIRHLFRLLGEHGLRPVTVSHERSKSDRREAIAAFARPGDARVLVITDIAARGLDVAGVGWVFHYDLPHSAPAYVHRAGRTGRSGHEGRSVVLVSDDKRFVLDRFARELGIRFTPLRGKDR
jgi:ATP-dependent RNA helicase DeaD